MPIITKADAFGKREDRFDGMSKVKESLLWALKLANRFAAYEA